MTFKWRYIILMAFAALVAAVILENDDADYNMYGYRMYENGFSEALVPPADLHEEYRQAKGIRGIPD